MDCKLKVGALLAGALIMSTGAVQAMNITINDGVAGTRIDGWDGGATNTSFAKEDNEVEPNCTRGQVWDLEGFYLNGNTLSMVGGYDFVNGLETWTSGDIFIDVTGDVVYGTDNYSGYLNGTVPVANTWGYDYAIDLNFSTKKYTLYAIDNDTLLTAYYRQNDKSNPWEYNSGGTKLVENVDFSYNTYLTDALAASAGYNVTGGTHNVVSLDIGFLPAGTFTSHFTMECGNDNLMGQGTKVPESGTLLLLSGFLVMSLPVIRRFGLN